MSTYREALMDYNEMSGADDELREQYSEGWFRTQVLGHPTAEDCDADECIVCAWRDCPHNDPLHYHHDGCPACDL